MGLTKLKTPFYVLLKDQEPLGIKLSPADSQPGYSVIYGFSDKLPYDVFLRNSGLELTPYPLVKGFLRRQIEATDASVKIIILDASGPDAEEVHAATMDSVLKAQELGTKEVDSSITLNCDRETKVYRVAAI